MLMKLKWKMVKKHFDNEFFEQHSNIDDDDDVKEHLVPHEHVASQGLTKHVSYCGTGGTAKQRSKMDDRNDQMHNVSTNAKRGGRSDKKKVRAWMKQNEFLENTHPATMGLWRSCHKRCCEGRIAFVCQ